MIELVEFDGQHIPALFEQISPLMGELTMLINLHEIGLRDYAPFAFLHSLIAMIWGYFLSSHLISHLDPKPVTL